MNTWLRRAGVCLLAALLLVTNILPGMTFAAERALTGSGTEADPYVISASTDFSRLQNSDQHFVLGSDINLYNKTPIDFSGVLDGNGHTITFHYTATTKVSAVALFRSNNGTIRNLELNCSMAYTFYETDTSGKMAGLCITNNGTIENCDVTGSIDTTVFDTDYNSADTAGICIENNGSIRDSGVYADIRSNCNSRYCSDELAGICITNKKSGVIERCIVKNYMNADDYAAGIARSNYGKIRECCTAADISYQSVAFANNNFDTASGATGTVENCISFSNLSAGTGITKGCKNCITAGTYYYNAVPMANEAVNCYDIGSQGLVNSNYGLYLKETFSAADFSGFDFQKVWYITDYGVPYLRGLKLPAPKSISITGPEELRVGGKQTMELEISPQNAVLYSLDYQFTEGEHTAQWSRFGSDMRLDITPVSTGQTRLVIRDAVADVLGFKNFTITQGVESITISGPNRIGLGQTVQLTGTVSPDNATNKNFHFEAPKDTLPTRLKVTPDGQVTGLVLGDAWLFAVSEDGNIRQRFEIEVVNMPLSVTLNHSKLVLYPGEVDILQAQLSPSDVEDSSYVWETDNPTVVTVDSNGRVQAKDYGTTVVRAVCNDGGAYGECTITVAKKPESFTLSGPETVEYGKTAEYALQIQPRDAVIRESLLLEYDAKILSAQQTQDGTIQATGLAGGKTTLLAAIGSLDLMVTYDVEVIRHPESVEIQEKELFLEAKQQHKLTATVLPEDSTNKDVFWTSDNEDVAQVSSDGVITAKQVGTATITCTTVDGNLTDTLLLHVQIPATSLELESTDITIYVDQIHEIKATILPENATFKTLLLEATTDTIAVDQENQSIRGRKPGTALLHVSTMDQKLNKTVFVTVLKAEHEYGEFSFQWAEDCSGCVMTRQCKKQCPGEQTVACTITKNVVDADCETEGYTLYKAEAYFEGKRYQDEKKEPLGALGHDMGPWNITLDATCIDEGTKTALCQRENCGYKETETIPATGIHSYTNEQDINCDVCGYERQIQADPDDKDEPTDPTEPTDKDQPTEPTEPTDKDEPVKVKTVPVYRLYNPYTQEHLLTGGAEERDALISVGWSLDGIAWEAPVEGISVYRLYNPYDDWHTYTTSESERDTMVTAGWTVDGVVSFGYTGKDGRSIYRLFNPYVQTNFHLFTAGTDERDLLVNAGWVLEGVAWYAVK